MGEKSNGRQSFAESHDARLVCSVANHFRWRPTTGPPHSESFTQRKCKIHPRLKMQMRVSACWARVVRKGIYPFQRCSETTKRRKSLPKDRPVVNRGTIVRKMPHEGNCIGTKKLGDILKCAIVHGEHRRLHTQSSNTPLIP